MKYTCPFENEAFVAEASATISALKDLKVLKLPKSTESIEAEAFMGGSFEAVIVPDGCKTIGEKAFSNCQNLFYIYIPKTVEKIAEDAFPEDVILDYESVKED